VKRYKEGNCKTSSFAEYAGVSPAFFKKMRVRWVRTQVFCNFLKCVMAAAISVMLLSLPLSANDTPVEFMLLATSRTATMQTELDEAAGKGFRIAIGSGLSGQEISMILEKMPEGSEKYSYRLLATARTSTMEKEINEAAREGFRLHPRSFTTKTGTSVRGIVSGKDTVEIVVVMERDPNQKGKEYEYKLLATSRTGTLQKEITEAVKEGYVLAAFGTRDEHMAIMEREKK